MVVPGVIGFGVELLEECILRDAFRVGVGLLGSLLVCVTASRLVDGPRPL